MSSIVFVAVDDTDIKGSPGTGHIARELAKNLEDLKLGVSLGITRHQLLVDSRIKYTSKNSSKCIAMKTDATVSNFYEPSLKFVTNCLQQGADPGLCICRKEDVNDEIIDFGIMATRAVLQKQDAVDLAKKNNIFLKEIGGSGDGVIGALAGVALRRKGDSGRFIELKGIRDIHGLVTVGEIKQRTDIDYVQNVQGKVLDNREIVDSKDWLRPSLFHEKAVLIVEPINGQNGERLWLSIEKGVGDKWTNGNK